MDMDDTCKVCQKQSDDMLMLSCIHTPCLNCAASTYATLTEIQNRHDPNIYICQICNESTRLDRDTVAELYTVSRPYVKVPSPLKGSQSRGVGNSSSFDKTKGQPKSPRTINKKVTNFFCKSHSQEQLTYYCFVCHENICPECAIHGAHKEHQVKLIKKAINDIKSEYLDVVSKIGVGQNNMNKFKDGFLRSVKQAKERNSREKALVSQQFQLLRNVLTNKQREVIKQLDNTHKQNMVVLENFIAEINKLYDGIEKTKKQIEDILNREDVLVFEEYKNLPNLEVKTQDLRKKSEDIAGQNSVLNTEFLQQELKGIQDLVKKFKHETKKEIIASLSVQKGSKKSIGDPGP